MSDPMLAAILTVVLFALMAALVPVLDFLQRTVETHRKSSMRNSRGFRRGEAAGVQPMSALRAGGQRQVLKRDR